MDTEILCPACGSDDHISGRPNGELIRLTCSACSISWDRDPAPRCRTCDRTDVEAVPQAAWDKARGTQLSVSYIRIVHLCRHCDAELLRRQRQTSSPLPPEENPAAGLR